MEELLQQLTEVSLRQQQIVEHLANRQGQLEQELAAQGAAARPRPAVPDPRIQAAQLLPKMTSYDDPEIFLQMFENVAVTEGWDRQEWARALAPLLTGEAQRSFYAMPADLAANYDDLKREILGRVGLSPICAAQGFFDWAFQPRRPARAQVAELTRLAQHWLLDQDPTPGQIVERWSSTALAGSSPILPPGGRHAQSPDVLGVSGSGRAG
ncbi:uncharacterized protein LOC122326033 [Puntigrus tetrazona]|uniref:uncharacterized protein LOC122326033 n=1 Tax=Puntigrus tetrazona TaxID=1606681 RepID=UPI001C898397|nr:uncharacterized protein LOC122326033 [Puntigrus tetrazona]